MRRFRTKLLRLSSLPIVAVAIFVRPTWRVESNMAFAIEFAGYMFLLAGLAVRIWCMFYISERKSRELITTGPYSISRNPLYIGTFLLVVGASLCFENPVMLVIGAFVFVPTHVAVVLMEERHLETIFGEEFRAYKKKVRRFWPSFRNYQSPRTVTVATRMIGRIAIDTLGVLLLPEVEDLIELLHVKGVLPVLWYFP
jgi:protein-S-isoprenylcysteine O-methyltransferase Ste14